MDKPFSLKYRETRQSIANIINTSNLPADIIQSIMSELLSEVKYQADRLYINDLQSYNEALNKQKPDCSDKQNDD